MGVGGAEAGGGAGGGMGWGEPQPQARRVDEYGRASRGRRRGESINMVRVKVCGITRLEDAMTAVEAGAAAPGGIFVGETPRLVTPGRGAAPRPGAPPVGAAGGGFLVPPAG